MKKLRVGVIYGGRSGEHEVSLASAAAVFKNLDPDRYDPVAIRIEKDGRWTLPRRPPTLVSAADVIAAQGDEGRGRAFAPSESDGAPVRPRRSAEREGADPDLQRETHLVAHPGGDTLLTIDPPTRLSEGSARSGQVTATVSGLTL